MAPRKLSRASPQRRSRISTLMLLPLPCVAFYMVHRAANNLMSLDILFLDRQLRSQTAEKIEQGENASSSLTELLPRKSRRFQFHPHFIPYHQLAKRIKEQIHTEESQSPTEIHNSYSSYSQATIKPIPSRKLCRATCCVEPVAISLDQDENKIINTEDGKDLADVRIEQHGSTHEEHLPYFASNLHPDMVPCFIPGTIIHIDNHRMAVKYFFYKIRPLIKVPFILITSASDDDTPSVSHSLKDPLLVKWYGTNPDFPTGVEGRNKLVPMHLGLSYQHAQSKFLTPYLQINEFSNPFANLDRFNLTKYPVEWDEDVFVHFRTHKTNRVNLWNVFCPYNSTDRISCNPEQVHISPHDIYTDMSYYRFGISPAGEGYDCYRTYELLLLGVIPIIQERNPSSHELFENLPVIHMPNLDAVKSKEQVIDAIQSYINSPAFQNANFEEGWKRLFMDYTRQQLLRDSGRDDEIMIDENGRKFYQGYRYTTTANHPPVYCADEHSCKYRDVPFNSKLDTGLGLNSELTKAESSWLAHWDMEESVQQEKMEALHGAINVATM